MPLLGTGFLGLLADTAPTECCGGLLQLCPHRWAVGAWLGRAAVGGGVHADGCELEALPLLSQLVWFLSSMWVNLGCR